MSASAPFFPKLRECSGVPYRRRCFRVVDLHSYQARPNPVLLFDLGPKIGGGQRFSPPGDHRGLYVSAELATAGAEFADGAANWSEGNCAKHVVFDMEVCLGSVLDLTQASLRRTLKISKEVVQSAWQGFAEINGGVWPATWNLGREVFKSGRFDGILFPSTKRASGTCVLIFTERLLKGRTGVWILRPDGSEWESLP